MKKMIYELCTCVVCVIIGFSMGLGYFMGYVDRCYVEKCCDSDKSQTSRMCKCDCEACSKCNLK